MSIEIVGVLARNAKAELFTDAERFRERSANMAWSFAAWIGGVTIDGVPLQTVLRAIVDEAWREAADGQEVASSAWADQIIEMGVALAMDEAKQQPKGGAA